MKKLLATMMGVCMLASCCCMAACNTDKPEVPPTHTEHVDSNNDGKCDTCGEDMTTDLPHTDHVDNDNDGKCDECGETMPGSTPSTDPGVVTDDAIQNDRGSIEYIFNKLYKPQTIVDEANGFAGPNDVTGARFFINGNYYTKLSDVGSRQDVKVELYNGSAARMVNVSAGMEFTIPTNEEINVDYEIAKYRTQYEFGDSVLTFSANGNNPYTSLPNGWYVYVNEWAIRHLVNPSYYANNGLTLLNDLNFEVTPVGTSPNGTSDGERNYPTVKTGDLKMREGYEIYRFDIQVNDEEDGQVERPFYNIGLIHEVNDMRNFALFVMKSKENKADMMDAIMMSYRKVTAKGITRNYFNAGAPVEDPHWNEETTAFFRQFMNQTTKSWGVFSYSMPGQEGSLLPGQGSYDYYLNNSKTIQKYIEEKIWGGKEYDIYMTYTHLAHYYPVAMSKELASGNGVNGKPALEFTYQFTTNNNLVDQEMTPMFDIMRGKYDEHFKRLALDIKEYGKPVMFRLNNEMNTDWTSYSGIMNLLDPDIFTMTWRRLYNIFIENGVDNVIWVWNPIADSCPYSGWGEDLCYFPGVEYVQLLGGTSYEMNNYTGNALTQMKTFKTHYSALYEKNKAYFGEYGMIIGEFACGSGGDVSGVIGRNRDAQAEWVRGMFEELNKENPADYVKQIKGLIWFNCNDYVGAKISNRLKFTDGEIGDRPGEDYSDLVKTWEAFRKGFEDAKKLEKK